MAIGMGLFVPNQFMTFCDNLMGVDADCCSVCLRHDTKLYCPKLLCKWRDKKYSDYTEHYRRKK